MSTVNPYDIRQAIAEMDAGKQRPFAICKDLADKVADLLEQGDERALRCLEFVSETYSFTDSGVLRLAIENCFIYHLGTRISMCPNHAELMKKFPQNLRDLALHQLMTSGI